MSQIASVSLSVRELVEFILASGSIDNRGGSDLYQRANEGARLHRKLQKRSRSQYGEIYQPEVTLSDEREVDGVVFISMAEPMPSSMTRRVLLLRKSKPPSFP